MWGVRGDAGGVYQVEARQPLTTWPPPSRSTFHGHASPPVMVFRGFPWSRARGGQASCLCILTRPALNQHPQHVTTPKTHQNLKPLPPLPPCPHRSNFASPPKPAPPASAGSSGGGRRPVMLVAVWQVSQRPVIQLQVLQVLQALGHELSTCICIWK